MVSEVSLVNLALGSLESLRTVYLNFYKYNSLLNIIIIMKGMKELQIKH